MVLIVEFVKRIIISFYSGRNHNSPINGLAPRGNGSQPCAPLGNFLRSWCPIPIMIKPCHVAWLEISLYPAEDPIVVHGLTIGTTLSPCSTSDITLPPGSASVSTLPPCSAREIIPPLCFVVDVPSPSCSTFGLTWWLVSLHAGALLWSPLSYLEVITQSPAC